MKSQREEQDKGLKVFISNREKTCGECKTQIEARAWFALTKEREILCLTCADLDHLVFLPSGDAALTRRARKHSTLSAIVLKWSRARKRFERQGVLVESQGLEKAEEECLADSDARERRRIREAERREVLDRDYTNRFAAQVRALFPKCPKGTEREIAEHACLKYSGRVGRSAAAKELDDEAVRLAVIAHVRHKETRYDELLAQGFERFDARSAVNLTVRGVLESWEA